MSTTRGPAYAALNERQKTFVDGILAGKTQTQAALDAGYSENSAPASATRLLKKAEIIAALQEGRGPRIASADEVQEFLTATLRDDFDHGPEEAPPRFKPMTKMVKTTCPACEHKHEVGVGVGPSDRIKAAEHIAKIQGQFITKVEHSGSVAITEETLDISGWAPEHQEEYLAMLKEMEEREAEIRARAEAEG